MPGFQSADAPAIFCFESFELLNGSEAHSRRYTSPSCTRKRVAALLIGYCDRRLITCIAKRQLTHAQDCRAGVRSRGRGPVGAVWLQRLWPSDCSGNSDSPFLRLANTPQRDDYASMVQYSAQTRVELTTLGLLCLLQEKLKDAAIAINKQKEAEHQHDVGMLLLYARFVHCLGKV